MDCSLTDAIFKNVRGIRTFKLYFQTPRYKLTESPERGDVGSLDNLWFTDIAVDLASPIDTFPEYLNSDPLRGTFAAFELGAKIGRLYFENIDITLYDHFPCSRLVCIGPKSVRSGEYEVFDPYLSSYAERIEFSGIRVNGKICRDPEKLFREISFTDINGDGRSTGKGEFGEIIIDGEKIK